MPYLILNGVADFIVFAKNVFNAVETMRYPAEGNLIVHAEINIAGTTIMMGDSTEQWTQRPASLFIYSENVDGDYKRAIQNGGKTIMEPEDKEYGRTCGVEDPFGNVWWITSLPNQ